MTKAKVRVYTSLDLANKITQSFTILRCQFISSGLPDEWPCKNGGTRVDAADGGSTCICLPGFADIFCEGS